jgi:hypothetical protein
MYTSATAHFHLHTISSERERRGVIGLLLLLLLNCDIDPTDDDVPHAERQLTLTRSMRLLRSQLCLNLFDHDFDIDEV